MITQRAIQAFVQLIGTQRRHHHGLNAIRRSEIKLYAVLQAYRQVKHHVNSHDMSDPMDKQMTMLEMMEVNVEYIRTKIEDLSELFHNQTDRQQSKRKMSNLQLAINSTLPQQQQTSPTMNANTNTTVSSVVTQQVQQQQQELAKNGPSKPNAIPLEYPEGGGLSHSGRSSRHINTLVVISSTSNVNGQVSHQNEPSLQLTAVAPAPGSTASVSSTSPVSPDSRNLRSESKEMPEWVILLETTLQTILAQVGRVSSEVEVINLRVNDHIDDVENRVAEIEKKLTVQNAFREITRSASKPGLFKRDSFGMTNGAASAGATVASGSGMASGSMQPMPLQRSRSHRQSIRNFLTQKDLEEF